MRRTLESSTQFNKIFGRDCLDSSNCNEWNEMFSFLAVPKFHSNVSSSITEIKIKSMKTNNLTEENALSSVNNQLSYCMVISMCIQLRTCSQPYPLKSEAKWVYIYMYLYIFIYFWENRFALVNVCVCIFACVFG